MSQDRKDFDLLQIIEEGVKQGYLIHLPAMGEVICNFRIIALSGVPE